MEYAALYIADCAQPFFDAADLIGTVNWSKIPFAELERENHLDAERCRRILDAIPPYLDRLAADGYNAITLDDLAHLFNSSDYPETLRTKIESWRPLYESIFAMAKLRKLQVFITTDILFCPEPFRMHIREHPAEAAAGIISRASRELFRQFPAVAGIVARLGEADGLDVADPLASRIVLKTPQQCNVFLKKVLPVFEGFKRTLILRTWTLGAYPIGDLIWNSETQLKAFADICSDALVISRKPGDADFFRGLKVNPLFHETQLQQIVELQARREYEGFGMFPFFAGAEYSRIHEALITCRNVIGIMVWHQTGGWSSWQTRAFSEKGLPWIAINSFAALRIFRYDEPPFDTVRIFVRKHCADIDAEALVRLLAISEVLMREVWYLPAYTEAALYFRRVRIPVLPWVFWDTILVNSSLRSVVRRAVKGTGTELISGRRILKDAQEMITLAYSAGVEMEGVHLLLDTAAFILLAREYFLGDPDPEWELRLKTAAAQYRIRHPRGFLIEIDTAAARTPGIFVDLFLRFFVRRKQEYRSGEKHVLTAMSGLIYPIVKTALRSRLPAFTEKQAMGIQFFFR